LGARRRLNFCCRLGQVIGLSRDRLAGVPLGQTSCESGLGIRQRIYRHGGETRGASVRHFETRSEGRPDQSCGLSFPIQRERIARDLHDILGHTLTMVALKSDIADRMIETDPSRARQEIKEIRDASRHALRDVRAVVAGMALTTIDEEDKAKHSEDNC